MRRIFCVLLALAVLPCFAAAEYDGWAYYESVLDFSIQYPADLLDVYGVPEEEEGWNSEVFEPVSGGDGALLTITRADETAWDETWPESGFPDFKGNTVRMDRVAVDEPGVELAEVPMDMHYGMYRSADGGTMAEVIVLESPTDDLDYVIIARFPADDGYGWQDIFDGMIETLEFPRLGASRGAFTLRYDFTGGIAFDEVTVDEGAEAMWLYAEPYVTDFVLEEVEWDDAAFTVTGAKTLYTADRFSAEDKALCIYAWIPDMMPTLRFRGVDPDGTEQVWYISASGMDGSLMLLSEPDLFY